MGKRAVNTIDRYFTPPYAYSMKKILILILTAVISLSSLSAAREYIILAASVDFDRETGAVPAPGIYSQYQFGFLLNDKVSLGFGTYINAGFPINAIKQTGYRALLNVAAGPAFAVKLSESGSLSFIIGPDIAVPASRAYSDKVGFGVGMAVAYNYIPLSEQRDRVQAGLTLGFSGALTYYEDYSSSLSFSGRAFFGFTILQPFIGVYYPDVYDAVLDTVYRWY